MMFRFFKHFKKKVDFGLESFMSYKKLIEKLKKEKKSFYVFGEEVVKELEEESIHSI